jgi:hypothetical protein
MSDIRYASFDKQHRCYRVRNRGAAYWYRQPDGRWTDGQGNVIDSDELRDCEIRSSDERIIKASGRTQ